MTTTKMPGESTISKDWKPIYRRWWFWVIEIPIVVIFVGALLRIPALNEKERTQEVVAQIHAQKLTLADVNGGNLPPQPDPALADATIEGVDANGNGIRDDVELAIFKKYPNSAKIRAAELQYAMALQMEFAYAFNSETLVNVIEEEGRGYLCIANDERIQEVENWVVNTGQRKQFREDVREKYMASFGLSSENECDLKQELFTD